MRYVYLAAFAALAALTPSAAFGQTPSLSITNYQFVSEQRITLTSSKVTYRGDLVNNTVGPLASVTATLTSLNTGSFTVVPGQNTLTFAPVPANSQTTSSNTFTILVNRTAAFDPTFSQLQWNFQSVSQAPVANAGPSQSVKVGVTVTLNGSGSTNPSGIGTLAYSWAFTARPAGSAAALSNPTSVMPTFVPDVAGNYVIALTVSNGVASSTASVTVGASTTPQPPVANAGPNQTINVGTTVVLNGSGSTSSSGNPLTYAFTLTSRPVGSTAALTGANTVSPTFVADKPGAYTAQLIVNDGLASSTPSTVTITTQVVKPVANAGPNQTATINTPVQLNGSGSTDANGLPLTYLWSLISLPQGSAATLSSTTAVNPTFTPDRQGTYVAQLIVNNGTLSSDPATVTITTNQPLAPTANAGPNQTVVAGGTVVTLNGSGTDLQNLPLTFKWTLINKPTGSAAILSSAVVPNPTFVADLAGTYIAQLVVNNGFLPSPASTVTINTTCSQPTANPGPNQNVIVGATVTLNGNGSGDACRDPLTYSFTLTTRPAGSTATLSGANTVSPTFVADVVGTYVAQLIVNNGFTPSNPATVTITVATTPTITLTPNPVAFNINAPGALTLTLSSAAGAGGQVVNLSSGNTAVATVPATVTVAAGSTTANIPITAASVGSTTVTASASGFTTGTATVNVNPQPSITVSNASVNLGLTANLLITLSAPAPAGGVTVTLASSDTTKVTVSPASVTIAAGATTPATPPQLTGTGIGSASITASAVGFTSGSGTATVNAPTMSFTGSPLAITVGSTGTLTLNLAGGQAPAGGLTVNLISSDPTKATVPATLNFTAGATSATVTVTGVAGGSATITASAAGIASATATVNVASLVVAVPGTTTIGLGQSAAFAVNLSQPAPAGGVTVTLASSDTTKVTVSPATVAILQGATAPATQPQVTGAGIGSATITASAPGYTSGTGTVTVTAPTMSFTGSPLGINVGATGTLTLTLAGGQAPAGGLTVNLISSDSTKATVPATVNFAAAATSATVTVTGVAMGSATITASAAGIASATAAVTVRNAALIVVPATTTVGLGQSTAFSVTLSAPAPVGGVTVTLASSNATKVTVSPAAVNFAAGATTPSTLPQVAGIGIGSATITASATGFTSATGTVTVPAPTLSFSDAPLTINAGAQGTLTLKLTGGQAPAGGLAITLSSSNPAAVTVPGSVTFPAGMASVVITPVTGVAPGSAVITASAPNIAAAIGSVSVVSAVSPLILPIVVPSASVGQNLQTSITISLVSLTSCSPPSPTCAPAGPGGALVVVDMVTHQPIISPVPAPTGGLLVSVTSSDPSKLLIAGAATCPGPPAVCGSQQVKFAIPQTLSTASGVYLQGLASSGTVTITASALGFPSGQATITLTPSGFQLAGPGGASSFTTNAGAPNTALTASAVRLDSSLNAVEPQAVRAGYKDPINGPFDDANGTVSGFPFANLSGQFAATVNVNSSTPAVGTVVSPAVFAGGDTTATAQFKPLASGSTSLTAVTPPGFSTPNTGTIVTAVVNNPGISCATVPVGQSLETIASCNLQGGSAAPGMPVTITASDPKILLSAIPANGSTCTDTGSSTITIATRSASLGGSNIIIPAFCVYGVGNSGTSTYTVGLSGFATGTGTVTLGKSGFVIAGPGGIGAPSFTPFTATTPITVFSALLDSSSNFVAVQPLAIGQSASVTVASSNTSVGTLSPTTLSFTGGMSSNTTTFTKGSGGTTVLSVATPAGFSAPAQDTSVTATVASQSFSLSCDTGTTIGQNLETNCTVAIGQPAPAGGVSVLLTSNSPASLLLSTTAPAAGLTSITATIPGGGTSATFFAQSLVNSGSATYSASSSGFVSRNGTVAFAPSGVVIAGPFGLGAPFFFASVSGGQTPITVFTGVLNTDPASCGSVAATPCFQGNLQALRGGIAPLQVTLNSSSTAVGTIASPVSIPSGSGSAISQFTPVSPGSTTVSVVTPAGFTTSINQTTLAATVNP